MGCILTVTPVMCGTVVNLRKCFPTITIELFSISKINSAQFAPAVDIWAAGCVLGELLLGGPLVGGENEMDQINKVSGYSSLLHGCNIYAANLFSNHSCRSNRGNSH